MHQATGDKVPTGNSRANLSEAFKEAQFTIMQLTIASVSMELVQCDMTEAPGAEMWNYMDDFNEGKTNAETSTNQ